MNNQITQDDVRSLLSGITHLSFSAVRDFLDDPRNFRKRWIDHDWNEKKSMALVEGTAYHAALEAFWDCKLTGKENWPDAVREAISRSVDKEFPQMEVTRKRVAAKDTATYEAAGCRIEVDEVKGKKYCYAVIADQQIKDTVQRHFDKYLQDLPEYTPRFIEVAHVAPIEDAETGEFHAIPLKARIDLVATIGKDLVVIDHKLNHTEPDYNDDGDPIATPAMILQACAYDSLVPSLMQTAGLEPQRPDYFIFDVFSKTSGRRVPVKITLTKADRVLWSRLYRGVITKLALSFAYEDPTLAFLPNPFGMWQQDGWEEFVKDVAFSVENGEERETKKEKAEDYEAYDL